jgi:hypothetical protein
MQSASATLPLIRIFNAHALAILHEPTRKNDQRYAALGGTSDLHSAMKYSD